MNATRPYTNTGKLRQIKCEMFGKKIVAEQQQKSFLKKMGKSAIILKTKIGGPHGCNVRKP